MAVATRRHGAQPESPAAHRAAQAVLYLQKGIKNRRMTIQSRHAPPDDIAAIEGGQLTKRKIKHVKA